MSEPLTGEVLRRCRLIAARYWRPHGPFAHADLLQVAIAEVLAGARERPGATASFLLQRAEWRIRDLYRARKPVLVDGEAVDLALEHAPSTDLAADPHDRVERLETRREVRELLARAGLSDRHVRVLALLYGQDLSEHEVAAALGLSPAAVKSVRHRALERLRRAA